MKEEALREIGLSDREIKVYLALLSLGHSLASKISEKTAIPRTLAYDILKDLKDKGMVSFVIKENRKYFRAISPEEILRLIKEKDKLREELMQESLEELKSIQFKETQEKPLVEIYEGAEGIKTLLNKILLEKPKEIISYGGSGISREVFPILMQHWHKRRQESRIKFKVLYNNTDEAKQRVRKHKEDFKLSEVRFGKIDYLSVVNTVLYNNVTILFYSSKFPFGVLIKSKEISKNNLKIFELLWKIARK